MVRLQKCVLSIVVRTCLRKLVEPQLIQMVERKSTENFVINSKVERKDVTKSVLLLLLLTQKARLLQRMIKKMLLMNSQGKAFFKVSRINGLLVILQFSLTMALLEHQFSICIVTKTIISVCLLPLVLKVSNRVASLVLIVMLWVLNLISTIHYVKLFLKLIFVLLLMIK